MKPPPVICNARVLEYAVTEEAMFTGKLQLYVDGVLLGAVPGFAICESFNSDELLLFHCDEDWDVLGIQPGRSLKVQMLIQLSRLRVVPKNIMRVSRLTGWPMMPVSKVRSHTVSIWWGIIAAPFAAALCMRWTPWWKVTAARICNLCVTSFHEEVDQTRG
jgi:hypothetical protein